MTLKELKSRFKVGVKVRMTKGYLAGTDKAIREIAIVQSNAIAFSSAPKPGFSWLYWNDPEEKLVALSDGFQVVSKISGEVTLQYQFVEEIMKYVIFVAGMGFLCRRESLGEELTYSLDLSDKSVRSFVAISQCYAFMQNYADGVSYTILQLH